MPPADDTPLPDHADPDFEPWRRGLAAELLHQAVELVSSGVPRVCLLSQQMSARDAPSCACTPDPFPDLMAAAIQKRNLAAWAARKETVTR